MRGASLPALLVLGLSAAPVLGETPARSFAVQYEPGAGCPSREAFVDAVRARAPGAVELDAGAARFAFYVELEPSAGGFRGVLRVEVAGGSRSEREIPAAVCPEVLTSMAVIAAMVMDSSSNAAPAAEPTDAEPEARAGSVALVAPRPDPPAKPRPKAVSATLSESPTRDELDASRPLTASGFRLRPGLTAAGGVQTGAAPEATLALAAGVDLAFASDEASAPSARLRGLYSESGVSETASGSAEFRLLGAEVTGCAQRFPHAKVGVRPCFLIQIADLRGKGETTIDQKTNHMLWLGFGAALRFEAALTRLVSFDVETGLVRLTRSDRFVFDPEHPIHQVPDWALALRAGPTIRF